MQSQNEAGFAGGTRTLRQWALWILSVAGVLLSAEPLLGQGDGSERAEPAPYALQCTEPIHYERIPVSRIVVPAEPGARTAHGNCGDSLAGHSSADFVGPDDFSVVTCFAELEIAAASFSVDEGFFPIEVTSVEMVFASLSEAPTTTTVTLEVWPGNPGGALAGFVVGDFVLDPKMGITSVVVDLRQNPIVVNHDDGAPNTFSVGYRLDVHNDQTGSGCSCLDIPVSSNAFPTADTDGVDHPADNWYFEDPGCLFACNAGWIRFQDMGIDCVPSGDWALQATWRPVNCPDFGACCDDDGTCQNQFALECNTAGGTFQGVGSMCGDGIVDCEPKGSCCLVVGENAYCFDNQTEDACSGLGGEWLGIGSVCDTDGNGIDDACAPELGACCLPDGSCASRTQDDCAAGGGQYHGDQTVCLSVDCVGACCAGASCLEDTPADGCPFNWYGPLSSCGDQPSPCLQLLAPGACCKVTGECEILDKADCVDPDSWQGPNSTCEGSMCDQPLGACCGTGAQGCGCASNVTAATCVELGGSWAGPNSTCATDCTTCQACCKCQDSGVVTCIDVQPSVCTQFGGEPLGSGTSCLLDSCAPPVGACCGPGKDVCANLSQFQCASLGGAWQGCNGVCEDDPCVGCSGDAECNDMIDCTTDVCVGENCQNIPNDALCNDQDPCTADSCSLEQGCVHTALVCDDGLFCNGTESCSGGFCQAGVPPCPIEQCDEDTDMCSGPVLGACCVDETCTPDQSSVDCTALGGLFQGVATVCAPNPCLATGACCVSGTGCVVDQTASECAAQGGVYQGNDSVCLPNPCPTTGACCVSGLGCAEDLTAAGCADLGGAYQGDGSDCSSSPCVTTGACCTTIGCISNQSSAQCASFGGVYQGNGSTCQADTCLLSGACCIAGLGCVENQAPSACASFGGAFQGNGSTCVSNPCPAIGACCIAALGCVENQAPTACAGFGGTYQGDGSTCASNPCPTTGACCVGGFGCIGNQTLTDCTGFGGAFQGIGSSCTPNPCVSCTDSGDCDDGIACTTDDCVGDSCQNLPDNDACEDGDACTDDVCNGLSGCMNIATNCADGDACTVDSCDPVAGCTHDPLACDDGDACTLDTCDPASGCVFETLDCDDGDACTTDGCASGGCINTPMDCDDGNPCTEDLCSDGVCSNPPACDDGFFCNGMEGCDPQTGCQAGTPPCPAEMCNEAADDCKTPPATGACCDCQAVCSEVTEAQCLLTIAGGSYLGDGASCATAMCECPQSPDIEDLNDPNLNCSAEGCVNAPDLAVVLGAWGNPGCRGLSPCCADFTGDGSVNAADLAVVLGFWGCPEE